MTKAIMISLSKCVINNKQEKINESLYLFILQMVL